MNELQLLKMYGRLPNVLAKDLPSVTVTQHQHYMLAARTCGTPDAADREIAETDGNADIDTLANLLGVDHEECVAIIDMHRGMLLSDSGEYNNNRWGKCVSSFPDNHALTYFLDLDTFDAEDKRPTTRAELELIAEAGVFRWTLEQLLDECLGKPMVEVAYDWFILESYRVLGCQHVRVFDGPNGKHNVHVYATNALPPGVIGRAWFPSGSCGDHLNHQIKKRYHPGLIGMCKVGTHEWGHGHGEPHQFTNQGTHQGVMSYRPPRLFYGFSTGRAPHVLPVDPSLKSLIDKYGGVPVPLKDTPTPVTPTPPQPPTEEANSLIVIDGVLYKGYFKRA